MVDAKFNLRVVLACHLMCVVQGRRVWKGKGPVLPGPVLPAAVLQGVVFPPCNIVDDATLMMPRESLNGAPEWLRDAAADVGLAERSVGSANSSGQALCGREDEEREEPCSACPLASAKRNLLEEKFSIAWPLEWQGNCGQCAAAVTRADRALEAKEYSERIMQEMLTAWQEKNQAFAQEQMMQIPSIKKHERPGLRLRVPETQAYGERTYKEVMTAEEKKRRALAVTSGEARALRGLLGISSP